MLTVDPELKLNINVETFAVRGLSTKGKRLKFVAPQPNPLLFVSSTVRLTFAPGEIVAAEGVMITFGITFEQTGTGVGLGVGTGVGIAVGVGEGVGTGVAAGVGTGVGAVTEP